VGDEDLKQRRGSERLTGSAEAPLGRGLVHLGALVIAVPAVVLLIWHQGFGGGVGIYAAGLVGLYAVSAAYHLHSWSPAALRRLRKLDYATIYLFIAASMSPYCLLGVPGAFSRAVLWLGWLAAGVAVAVIVLRFEQARRVLSWGYLLLGWLIVVTTPAALRDLSAQELALLTATGLIYTAGAGVLAARWPDPHPAVFGYHEVWHAMVVLASASYFAFIWSLASSAR
jgi:hemolysin III